MRGAPGRGSAALTILTALPEGKAPVSLHRFRRTASCCTHILTWPICLACLICSIQDGARPAPRCSSMIDWDTAPSALVGPVVLECSRRKASRPQVVRNNSRWYPESVLVCSAYDLANELLMHTGSCTNTLAEDYQQLDFHPQSDQRINRSRTDDLPCPCSFSPGHLLPHLTSERRLAARQHRIGAMETCKSSVSLALCIHDLRLRHARRLAAARAHACPQERRWLLTTCSLAFLACVEARCLPPRNTSRWPDRHGEQEGESRAGKFPPESLALLPATDLPAREDCQSAHISRPSQSAGLCSHNDLMFCSATGQSAL